ncbi:MAG: hypothetical protein JJT95_03485 [Pararhodobacter sp.]|nr:hypothetical protein [Pararhodobacter sp.]
MRALLILLAFAPLACAPASMATRPAATATADPAARIAAECAMLERAQAETAARGLRDWPDVLVDCPGHEGLTPAMTMAQASEVTRLANAAALPETLREAGPRADIVYRRMITRGVPLPVAEFMATTPEFAAALR